MALADAEGRVLARDVVAGLDLPPWPNSAMDGYALRLADWQGEPLPVSQRILPAMPRHRCSRAPVRGSTGAPLPEGADCVQMQENAEVRKTGGCACSSRSRSARTCARKGRRPALAST